MFRPKFVLIVALALLSAVCTGADAGALPDAAALSKECYAQVGPVLKSAGGRLTPEVRNAYLDWAEKTVLQELRQNAQSVPEGCLAEVRKDGTLRDAMFGSVFPPDPSILQNYAQLRAQLGEKFLAKYRSLVIAVSVAKRIKDVEKPAADADIGRDYQPGFWVDESLQFPGSNEEKEFTRRIADFMKQSQISAADLFQNAGMQEQLKADLARHGIPAPFLAGVKKTVWFGERLKYAMVLLGQRPAVREAKPGTIAWLKHLVEIHEAKPRSTPTTNGQPWPWPLFPITTAPWPLLMPLAHPVPLSEANYIFAAYQGEYGEDRYHTYGPYRGDDDMIANSLNPSKWFWDAWPDRIVHGGMCVPISKGTVELYTSLLKPAMWAGQPGHANLISFQSVNGAWTAEIEQAFAGGPVETTAQWYFDEDPGTQIRFRDQFFWAGAEYHLGLALAMNVGLKPYMDTRIGANLFRTLPVEDKRTLGVSLLRDALLSNPFNPEVWYRLAEHNPDPMLGMALVQAAWKGEPGRLSTPPGNTSPEMHGAGGASDQYWRTVAQFETQLALLIHPAPRKIEDMHRVYNFLKIAPGVGGDDLVAYAEKYVERQPAEPGADNPEYDLNLAKAGDAYGQLRMGQRYRDGDGVPQSDVKAKEFLNRSASQGDVGAIFLLGKLYPALPGNVIAVTPSSVYDAVRAAVHLVDGSGIWGAVHDNEGDSKTMWHSVGRPAATPPAKGLAPSPAWVRFDFARPTRFAAIQIWNHNQARYTDRGFRKTRIYASADGQTWMPLTPNSGIELPQANGLPLLLPTTLPNPAADRPFKSVIVAAEAMGGNYGSDYYGLSAVHFIVPQLSHVIPAKAVTVTPSSVASAMQAAQHLVDGSGMLGMLHDNAEFAQTMWHTPERTAAQPPVPGLAPSPAWVRFDFAQPQEVESILIWNHNQANLTDRGFRKVRIYGSSDGVNWHALTASQTIELPRANGSSLVEPTAVPISLNETTFKSILIAADETDGNYGGSCFGLSAVRFIVRH